MKRETLKTYEPYVKYIRRMIKFLRKKNVVVTIKKTKAHSKELNSESIGNHGADILADTAMLGFVPRPTIQKDQLQVSP